MILCILVVMNYRFITNTIHEMLGLFTLLLFIMHNTLNRRWYTAISKGKMDLLRILKAFTNLLLCVMMVLVVITGVLISQTVFASLSLSDNILIHELHILFAYSGFILIAIHLGFHWNELFGKLYHLLKIDRTSSSFILLSRLASLFIISYGIYASFTRQIGSKLFLQHVVTDWAATPSLIGFIVDYAAIMGCYVAITYYLTQLVQKIRS
ncbi:hypothetical protein SPSIL_005490 [Sporomusa silvacetica DSM 10669]|uniref:Flavinylation-associated cytochrome domain-containing protein n=2 Tax=Sporomusa silvacetica TaxID=55504 RepID=A0ABZ3IFJ6_9FIRM|nr:hypothetical protein SPSIL_34910 [Sporomusa silvacetica DSM 10669]